MTRYGSETDMGFEEIDVLVRAANPVPDPRALAPVPPFLSAGDVPRRTAMQILELTEMADDPSGETTTTPIQRNGWRGSSRPIPVAAAAAVVVVALITVTAIASGDDSDTAGAAATPVELADSFLSELADYDFEAVSSYLAEDTIAQTTSRGQMGPFASLEELRSELRWREVTGFSWDFDSCEAVSVHPVKTEVICPYTYHGFGSDELGLGPFEGSVFVIVVRDGRIDRLQDQMEAFKNGFIDDVYQPFASWLEETHPEDADVLLRRDDDPVRRVFSMRPVWTDATSIDLWERRTREFVDSAPTSPADDASDTGNESTVTVIANDHFRFDAFSYETQAGEVTFEYVNEGEFFHSLRIQGVDGFRLLVAEHGDIARGTVDLDAGSYTLVCDIEAHTGFGMHAQLEVS